MYADLVKYSHYTLQACVEKGKGKKEMETHNNFQPLTLNRPPQFSNMLPSLKAKGTYCRNLLFHLFVEII